jgi:hypothetical protein
MVLDADGSKLISKPIVGEIDLSSLNGMMVAIFSDDQHFSIGNRAGQPSPTICIFPI